MLLTLGIIVLCSSILVFFSQEFTGWAKKLLAIPGVKLLLPLFLASWVVEIYEEWGQWLLYRFQAILHQGLHFITGVLPFEAGKLSIIRIIFLFILVTTPVWIYQWKRKQTGQRYPQPVNFSIGLMLWIIAVMLLSV